MKKRLLTVTVLLLVLISTCFLTACNQGNETTLQFVYADGEESPHSSLPNLVIDCSKVCRVSVFLGGFSSQMPMLYHEDKIQAYCKDILTGFVVTDDETYCNKFAASLSDFDKVTPPYAIQLNFENGTHVRFWVYNDGMFVFIDENDKGYVCTVNSQRIDVNKVKSTQEDTWDNPEEVIFSDFDWNFNVDFSK